MVKVTPLKFNEVLLLEYPLNMDNRGASVRTFSKRELLEAGITTDFVEEVYYFPAKKHTLYGIHFQNHPKAQTKLVFCAKGKVLDFAVDLRKGSATYKEWACVELSPANRTQVYIPAGFGHAALTLEDDTQIVYRIDRYHDGALSMAVRFDDPDLRIPFGVTNPIRSRQDQEAPSLRDSGCNL